MLLYLTNFISKQTSCKGRWHIYSNKHSFYLTSPETCTLNVGQTANIQSPTSASLAWPNAYLRLAGIGADDAQTNCPIIPDVITANQIFTPSHPQPNAFSFCLCLVCNSLSRYSSMSRNSIHVDVIQSCLAPRWRGCRWTLPITHYH